MVTDQLTRRWAVLAPSFALTIASTQSYSICFQQQNAAYYPTCFSSVSKRWRKRGHGLIHSYHLSEIEQSLDWISATCSDKLYHLAQHTEHMFPRQNIETLLVELLRLFSREAFQNAIWQISSKKQPRMSYDKFPTRTLCALFDTTSLAEVCDPRPQTSSRHSHKVVRYARHTLRAATASVHAHLETAST